MRSAVASAGSPTALSPAGKKPKLRRSFSATAAVPGLLPRRHARGNARPRIPAYTASWVTDASFRRCPVRSTSVASTWREQRRRLSTSLLSFTTRGGGFIALVVQPPGAQGERLSSSSSLYPRWAHNKHAWACFEATKTRQALLGAPLSQEDNACLPACPPARLPGGRRTTHRSTALKTNL